MCLLILKDPLVARKDLTVAFKEPWVASGIQATFLVIGNPSYPKQLAQNQHKGAKPPESWQPVGPSMSVCFLDDTLGWGCF